MMVSSLTNPATEIVYSLRVGELVDMNVVADLLSEMAGLQENAERRETAIEEAQEAQEIAQEELTNLREDCDKLADELEDIVRQLRSMRNGG